MIEVQVGDTIVEFPDGTSQEVMKNALQKRFGNQQQPTNQPTDVANLKNMMGALRNQVVNSPAASFIRSASNSLLFDGGDELLAGIGVGEGDTYSQRQRDLQKRIDRDYQENPIASYSGNVVGSLLPLAASALATTGSGGAASPTLAATGTKTLGSLGKLGTKIASRVFTPKTLAGNLASASAQGAAAGYLGADQDTRAMGAGIGAVAGPVGDLALRGLTKGGQTIKQLFETPALKRKAVQRLSNLVDAAGGSQSVQDNFNKIASDETMLMDALGGVGGNEARRVANLDMSVRSDLYNTVMDRHLGGNKRLSNVIENISGLDAGSSATPKSIIDDLNKTYRPRINEAYREARLIDKGPQEFIITPEIENSPVFKKAMAGVDDTILNLKATNPDIDPENPFDRLDALKQNLDTVGYTTNGFGQSVPAEGIEAKTARALSKQLLKIADDSFPAYKAARDLHREKALKQESVNLGQKLGRKATNRDVISAINQPNVDQEFVRKGYGSQASQSLLDRVQGKRSIDFIDSGNKEAFEKLYTPEQLSQIQRQIAAERAFNDTKNAVTANSTSAAQIADLLGDSAAGLGTTAAGISLGMDGVTSALLGTAAGIGRNVLRDTFKNRAISRDRQMAPYIAEMLMRNQIPDEILNFQNNALRQQMMRNLMGRLAAQPSAQTAVDLYRENK